MTAARVGQEEEGTGGRDAMAEEEQYVSGHDSWPWMEGLVEVAMAMKRRRRDFIFYPFTFVF